MCCSGKVPSHAQCLINNWSFNQKFPFDNCKINDIQEWRATFISHVAQNTMADQVKLCPKYTHKDGLFYLWSFKRKFTCCVSSICCLLDARYYTKGNICLRILQRKEVWVTYFHKNEPEVLLGSLEDFSNSSSFRTVLQESPVFGLLRKLCWIPCFLQYLDLLLFFLLKPKLNEGRRRKGMTI